MTLLTRQFLEDIGVHLDDSKRQALSETFETTLHDRVIDAVVNSLDDDQAKDLASLSNADDSLLQQWLTANVPQLSEIVKQEVDQLLGEMLATDQA